MHPYNYCFDQRYTTIGETAIKYQNEYNEKFIELSEISNIFE